MKRTVWQGFFALKRGSLPAGSTLMHWLMEKEKERHGPVQSIVGPAPPGGEGNIRHHPPLPGGYPVLLASHSFMATTSVAWNGFLLAQNHTSSGAVGSPE